MLRFDGTPCALLSVVFRSEFRRIPFLICHFAHDPPEIAEDKDHTISRAAIPVFNLCDEVRLIPVPRAVEPFSRLFGSRDHFRG
jgi:hypothetical protein